MAPKSSVWKFFEKHNKKPNELAVCVVCNKHLKACGNTSNLIGQIKAMHNDIFVTHLTSSEKVLNKTDGTEVNKNASLVPASSEPCPSTSSSHPVSALSSGFQQNLQTCFANISSFKDGGDKINNIITFNTSAPQMVSALDMEVLKDFVVMFKPIEFATKEACGDKFVTSSIVIPVVRLLRKKVMGATTNTNLGTTLKGNIMIEWNKRFKNIEHHCQFAMATILDPRFKNIHFDDSVAVGMAIRKLTSEMKEEEEETSSESDVEQVNQDDEIGDGFSLWDDHHRLVQESWKSKKRIRTVDELGTLNTMPPELSIYLKSPVVKLTDCPLDVWPEGYHKNSSLLEIAMKYLTVMATSVPSERVFSTTGNIVTCKRSCLSGEKLDKLLFLQTVNSKFWGLQ
ncbi:PREDICTED: uncharacterized protein LOC108371288 [Rhagoletis zephyria]|uniref:uncharacterized protein LOC108371288 n=1 Tax=Rhagoletis zephyria TaxID=28612 RepID=UPI0008116A99|nr:PREDICTED: uncharacterized protein LOC108371288 [Rhagoletis zephyria]